MYNIDNILGKTYNIDNILGKTYNIDKNMPLMSNFSFFPLDLKNPPPSPPRGGNSYKYSPQFLRDCSLF